MTIPNSTRILVRQRADAACEYCGVNEHDAAGELTVDHVQPTAHHGSDESDNLAYCCYRCNLNKGDYWPQSPGDVPLWNPRAEPRERHLLLLADGTLHPITSVGIATLERLRLNRLPLVAHRQSRLADVEDSRLLQQIHDRLSILEAIHQQFKQELAEHRLLLKQQSQLICLLLGISES